MNVTGGNLLIPKCFICFTRVTLRLQGRKWIYESVRYVEVLNIVAQECTALSPAQQAAMQQGHDDVLEWFLKYRSLEATGNEQIPFRLCSPCLQPHRARHFYATHDVDFTPPNESVYHESDEMSRF